MAKQAQKSTPKPADTEKYTWVKNQYDLWVKVAKSTKAKEKAGSESA